MSWISKAENLLNKFDQSAANVLQQQKDDANGPLLPPPKSSRPPPKVSSALNLRFHENDDRWESKSSKSEMSSISSKHETVIDSQFDEPKSSSNVVDGTGGPLILKTSSSNASLNMSFSVEKELAAAKILAAELRSENQELKGEVESLMDQMKVNSDAMKIQELEELCESLMSEKKSLNIILQTLENSNTNYVKTISELETSVMKLQQSENDLKQKLDYAKNESHEATNELHQYRLRAQNQLQLKEKLIEQLQSGDIGKDHNTVVDGQESTNLLLEIEQLRDQKTSMQSELELSMKRLEESRGFIEKMEHKHRMMQSESEDKISQLNSNINQLNLQCSHYDDELKLQKQELSQVREEMTKQKTQSAMKLHEKENELRRIKNSYRESISNAEVENRMHSLTQSLLSKQNILESITAERNALKLQLEKLSHQHEEMVLQLRQQRSHAINMNETDDAKSQIPRFMMMNPFDSRMSRRVKRAYSNLDQLGIRMGVFLRRYPLARIFSVFYVTLLHFFVMFVLLSSTPPST